ncbi:hypothetical protein [Sphingobacterium faecale]|uniref:Uncharacterized protein n=1 Tax=Sphingobacterium faecale TaxID=2803775 RepID=A0ABS1R634_9SPHI|nr:hypothetical protein [Sphingobacterium faecale]MBL1410166.1 hypothetical protein [Sphingobacterium faecale]
MEKQIEHVGEGTYKATCKPQYISFLYCLLISRISRGWSAEELSFLLGQEDDFIGNLERFIVFDYSVDLYGHLLQIMPEAHLLMSSVREVNEFNYKHSIIMEGHLIRYRMEQYVNEWESITVFELLEEDGAYRDKVASNSIKEELSQAKAYLAMLMEEGYFRRYITALEIFMVLKSDFCSHFQPKQLKTELDKLWGRKGTAPLKRTKRRSYGYRFTLHR